MRLQCDVEVVNRALPSLGLRGHSRSRRAVLSIGKHADRSAPSSGLYLLICTARDRSGSKYKAGFLSEPLVAASADVDQLLSLSVCVFLCS